MEKLNVGRPNKEISILLDQKATLAYEIGKRRRHLRERLEDLADLGLISSLPRGRFVAIDIKEGRFIEGLGK